MRLSRFERRILAAIIAVAVVTFGGALWFGQGAVSEAYHVGVNERVLAQLEESLAVYRLHFVTLREDAERTADAVSFDRRASAALAGGDRRGWSSSTRRARRSPAPSGRGVSTRTSAACSPSSGRAPGGSSSA